MRKYVIINAEEVSLVDFNQVLNTSADMVKWSLDGTKTFVKFEGDTPSFLLGEPQYDHSEILAILAGDQWTAEEEY